MRIALAVAVALGLGSIVVADPSHAAIRKPTNILAQELGSALKEFAASRDLQLLYFTDTVRHLQTSGAVGEITADEALTKILNGTGLTYRYIDDRTVTILPVGEAAQGKAPGRHAIPLSAGTQADDAKEAQNTRNFWDRFRLAQVDPEKTASDGRVEGTSAASQGTPVKLEEIVVTAQKREERLQNVPISISVLGGAALDRSTVGVSDALNRVPGIATQQDYLGGGTSVVIRGVAPSGPFASGSSAVAYYLDSIPFGLVRSALGPDSNAFDLQRVEVLRGPQGTLYGASALNGVVRVLTNDANLSDFCLKARVSDSVTNGGGNNYRGDVAVNIPLVKDRLAVRAIVGYENSSGWIDQPNKSDANDRQMQSYRLKVNAEPTEDLSIGLSAWSSRDDAGAPSVGYTFDKQGSLLDQPISTDYDAYGLKVGYRFPLFSISSATSYLRYTNEGTLGLDVPFFSAPDSLFFSGIDSNVFAQEVNLNSSTDSNWRWSAGGIYRDAKESIFQSFTGLFGAFPATLTETTSKSYAVYGEITRLFLQDRLEFTAGVRHFHDDVSATFSSPPGTSPTSADSTAEANTPRAVLTWHPSDRQMVYASYSQGFRSGFPQLGLPVDFPVLRPDRLRNYEVGSKGSFMDGSFAYDASLYYMQWGGIQAQLSVPYRGGVSVLAIVNGEGASGVGTDLSLSFEPVNDLTFTASVSWNDLSLDNDVRTFPAGSPPGGIVLFSKGDRPTSSPRTTAGASADYLFALGGNGLKGRFSVGANYTSSQAYRGLQGLNVKIQEGDPILLAQSSFSIESPNRWVATLFADNITNEEGAPVKVFIGIDNWNARVRPRTVGLQLQYLFQ